MRIWLTNAGPYKVEHVPCPRPGEPVDLKHPPLGLLHTTQGATIEGALAVFRQHYAPHFTVGVDAKSRVRILQHVPLGEMAAALMNLAGGAETNREVRVQIEIVGFCKTTPWLPEPPTLLRLAALLVELERIEKIPLRHPFVARNAAKWMKATGWVGHIDAPENDHTDPGKLRYDDLFKVAAEIADVGVTKPKTKPRKAAPLGKTAVLKRHAKKAAPSPLCVTTKRPTSRPAVKPGARGAAVRTLQGLLKKHGSKITVDGHFGPRTTTAVKAFQRRSGLTADGVVDAKTWAKLTAK